MKNLTNPSTTIGNWFKGNPKVAKILAISAIAVVFVIILGVTVHLWLPIALIATFIGACIYTSYEEQVGPRKLQTQQIKLIDDALVSQFLFGLAVWLATSGYLRVVVPQSISDIRPRHTPLGVAFDLIKTTPEQTPEEHLRFVEKILQSKINAMLNEMTMRNPYFQARYMDMMLFVVAKIVDFGTYYEIHLGYIINQARYEFYRQKFVNLSRPNKQANPASQNNNAISDEDF